MENIVVIYESKYGATKQYAQWIADDLECDLVSASETNPDAIMQHLNGAKAEQFVRWRKNNTGPSIGDIERVKNQQTFMTAIFDQKMNLATVGKVNDLFKVIQKKVNTNLTLNECLAFIPALKGNAITTIEMPGEAKMAYGASYYLYDAEKTQAILREQMGMKNATVVPCGQKPSASSRD